MSSVLEENGDSEGEDHDNPVDLRNVDLAKNPSWFVNNLHPREASQCIALFDNRERSKYDCLACDHCSQHSHHQNRPEKWI